MPVDSVSVSMKNNRQLPPEIYLRRRAAAAILLLVFIVLLIFVVLKFSGGDKDAQNTAATTTPVSTAPVSPTELPSSLVTTLSSAPPTSTAGEPTALAATSTPAKNSCELADLIVEARVNQTTIPTGQQPTFYMTITNPTKADCVIDTTKFPMRYEVYSLTTNQRVWSDIDCNAPISTGNETFKAGQSRHFEAVWSRTNSAPKQCSNRETVEPGAYFLHTVIGENPSDPITFNLAG
ncbi:hypothetical protein CCASP_01410 [Corynebacterium caspium DSM 44850]|nr:hypothetical protein CCASP_01410 [Corynebacterium caspium DSM 44850]